ncbi:MAG: hypothetical protein AAGI66_08855 [Cyanobacteria bacterium P01_H01_bin.74]
MVPFSYLLKSSCWLSVCVPSKKAPEKNIQIKNPGPDPTAINNDAFSRLADIHPTIAHFLCPKEDIPIFSVVSKNLSTVSANYKQTEIYKKRLLKKLIQEEITNLEQDLFYKDVPDLVEIKNEKIEALKNIIAFTDGKIEPSAEMVHTIFSSKGNNHIQLKELTLELMPPEIIRQAFSKYSTGPTGKKSSSYLTENPLPLAKKILKVLEKENSYPGIPLLEQLCLCRPYFADKSVAYVLFEKAIESRLTGNADEQATAQDFIKYLNRLPEIERALYRNTDNLKFLLNLALKRNPNCLK